MAQTSNTEFRERIAAGIFTLAGISALALSLHKVELTVIRPEEYLLAFLFAGAIVLADQYPIHLLRGTKLSLINLPMFLSAVMLSAPLAVLATGSGLLVANILARTGRGLLPRDIASMVGQWMFTVFLGFQILHLDLSNVDGHATMFSLLLFCAILFILIDFVVFSFSQSLIYGEPFIPMLRTVVQEGIALEGTQYLIGILGAIAASVEVWSLSLLAIPVMITYVAFKNIKETRFETVQILEDMADTVDLRDIYTGGHSKRVADLVHRTLFQLQIGGPEATLIEISARLHDIGKIGIPDRILMNPGRLTPEDMAVMQTHSEKGAELISKYRDFSRGASIIRHHHERWDGTGYPSGLKGYEIPFGARVIAVADSFDAMTSDRPYRKALSIHKAIQTLLEGRGTQWESAIVNAFVDMIMSQAEENAIQDPAEQKSGSTLPQTALVTS